MLDPGELLEVAELLLNTGAPPSQGQLRRAVSTAYYAVFHTVLRSAARRFVGTTQSNADAYTMLYRSFDHGHMRKVCEDLRVSTLKERVRLQLRRTAVSQDVRDFADILPVLQDQRHIADCDPTASFLPSDAASLIGTAKTAIEAFSRVPAAEQADVLAMIMVRVRQ